MLGLIAAINKLTAELVKIVTALTAIKTSQATIAANTTPADDNT